MDSIAQLKKTASSLPREPGVYLMRDFDGVIIYIGKAKDLRARVRTYFTGGDGRLQIEYLLRRVQALETIVTGSEEEALLLERDLINRHKPRYNIRLKDDKAYLSVRIHRGLPWPRIELVRRVAQDGALYFGPYQNGYQLREVLDVIKNVVPLRTCSDTVFLNRQRPCLEYQIKRCAGPCCLPVDREEYKGWIDQAIAILEGRVDTIRASLEEQMERAAEDLRFEEAAAVRDRIARLVSFAEGDRKVAHRGESADAFHLYREGAWCTVSILRARAGRISDVATFSFEDVHVSDVEVIESVISQFYVGTRDIPDEILLPFEIEGGEALGRILSQRRESEVSLSVPEEGSKARLVTLAEANARQQFSVRFLAEARYQEIAASLQSSLGLRQAPRRVECIDISNLQGSDIVGALVAFSDGAPDTKGYRKYKISSQGKPDDFASIYEVVSRRLGKDDTLPDLLVIDGGAGQLREALRARDALGVSLEIVSIAKMRTERSPYAKEVKFKPERIFVEGSAESIPLDEGAPATHFLQRVRDEVHRFVISFHRATRGKRVFRSVLDDIPGVGPERRARLLKHFGSVERIRDAAPEEIARVGRMPRTLAERIRGVLASSPSE